MSNTILENRRKWIDFLKQPDTKKARGYLVSGNDDGARCCLGHACHVLGATYDPPNRAYEGACHFPPEPVVKALGLWTREGCPSNAKRLGNGQTSLSDWNDGTPVTPQEIGAYLETVIMGGPDTPFREVTLGIDDRSAELEA